LLAWRYLKFIRKNNIDFVYCREARLLFFLLFFNKLIFRQKLKFSYEVHAIDKNFINGIIEKILTLWINKIILISGNLREIYVKKYKVKKEKTMVAPDGVDLKIFNINLNKEEARREKNLPLDKKILVYTGKFKTMGMDKGLSDIMKAVKILNDDNILFVAVGGYGEEVNYYDDLARKLFVSERVRLVSLSPQADLAIYQKAADVLLMPFPFNTHYAYYMSPLKMFEYMAADRPIITTDLPSIKEVLNNNNAIIVKPDNPEDLARGIKIALENKELADKISTQAFRDINKYTWEKRTGDILDFIK
jgi:glycosyltransferase involved in cell wall biosynthesis